MGIVPDQVTARDGAFQEAVRVDLRAGLHPGVLAAAAALHRDNARIRPGSNPCQAARHHHIALRRGAGIHPQADGASAQPAGRTRPPDGRLRQPYQFLGDKVLRIGAHPVDEGGACAALEVLAKNGKLPQLRKARFDDQFVEFVDGLFERGRFPAPPGGDRRHFQ